MTNEEIIAKLEEILKDAYLVDDDIGGECPSGSLELVQAGLQWLIEDLEKTT